MLEKIFDQTHRIHMIHNIIHDIWWIETWHHIQERRHVDANGSGTNVPIPIPCGIDYKQLDDGDGFCTI